MMDKDFNSLFSDIKNDLTAYIHLKLKIFKLETYEKLSKASSFLLYGLIVALVFFFVILFIFLALGLYLGELLHSTSLGITIIGLLYLIGFILLIACRKKVQAWLMNLFLSEISENEEEDEY